MSSGDDQARNVLAIAKSGDIPGAIAAGEAELSRGSREPALALFVGMLCCRSGDLPRGIAHLRKAVALAPGELSARIELARALLANGDNAEAAEVAAAQAGIATPPGREMQRIRAHALLRQGEHEAARESYRALTTADPADFESWHGLGAALLAGMDAAAAIDPLRQAVRLRPSASTHWLALARAQIATSAFDDAVASARGAVARAPDDAAAHAVLGRALAGQGKIDEALVAIDRARERAGGDAERWSEIAEAELGSKAFERAEASYRAALALNPGLAPALLGLAGLMERTNRLAELTDLLDQAERMNVPATATALLRARALRGAGDLQGALAAARASSGTADVAKRAQLIGEIADRLGDSDAAFAAFSEANAALALKAGDAREVEHYHERMERLTTLLTPSWYRSWAPARPSDGRQAPLFIFGFPRSGTTLIDTMLIGHPDTAVLEEQGIIQRTTDRLGPAEQLRNLNGAGIDEIRRFYFGEVDRAAPDARGRLVVDKEPLGITGTTLLHRMFPDARFVFAQRHPCDVVLSCFIISAQLNLELGHFFDLASTARLYDRVLTYWERCCEVLPIAVHNVRYERLIVDTRAELGALADFAGLAWDDRLVEHQQNAAGRKLIESPSYAQVAEPIYTRAKGRWLRYRKQMEPVLPILAPWIEKMGYDFG